MSIHIVNQYKRKLMDGQTIFRKSLDFVALVDFAGTMADENVKLRCDVERLEKKLVSSADLLDKTLDELHRVRAELEAVTKAGQRDAALLITYYQENQQLRFDLATVADNYRRCQVELQQVQQAQTATCEWSRDDDWDENLWESACGLAWLLEDEGPVENDMSYCPKCGKRLIVLTTQPSLDTE
jgi:hypothetical protein